MPTEEESQILASACLKWRAPLRYGINPYQTQASVECVAPLSSSDEQLFLDQMSPLIPCLVACCPAELRPFVREVRVEIVMVDERANAWFAGTAVRGMEQIEQVEDKDV